MIFFRLLHNELFKVAANRQHVLSGAVLSGLILLLAFIRHVNPELLRLIASTKGESALNFASAALVLLFLPVLVYSIWLGANVVLSEFKYGTAAQLLARPAGRAAVLLSKYTVVAIVLVVLLLLLAAVALLADTLLSDTGMSAEMILQILGMLGGEYLPRLLLSSALALVTAVLSRKLWLSAAVGAILPALTWMLPGWGHSLGWAEALGFTFLILLGGIWMFRRQDIV